ncbi:MAG: signal peptide peptidase SppA [Porticoccaceae bacterium]|nr:signal peptide peptidase SppA [Porticoccaceae bacterium]MBT4163720.1 signal peptide peptidase SppA [Porticoccaceae bacterium]MBT4590602.1 signal peptide peptidase SppA [Porticoccaceae bacterium]MBT6799479.1 signal peptide peptidase SppA [Porticoccaceae bacterium]MBT7752648.1 signal peptide peptidase SppA [Porticoccaceae bacterium]
MTEKKPGLFKRAFRILGNIFTTIRNVFSFLIFGFFILAIGGMFGDNLQPIPEKGALYLAPQGFLVDQKTYTDPFNQILFQDDQQNSETLVRDVVEAIDTALDDERITHLLLDTDYMAGGSLSKLEEIGLALKRFGAEKTIIAIGDNFTQSQYFLAAHANEIMLNPLGGVMITGFGSYRSYFKEALDNLKITMNIFRAGQYKSAVEPLMGNTMSPQVRDETQHLLGDLWQFYIAEIEDLRHLETGTINDYANNLHLALADNGGDSAALAKEIGLIDVIATRSEIIGYLNDSIPGSEGEFDSIDMDSYLANIRLNTRQFSDKENQIALVVASGTIMDGQQPEGSIGGDTLADIFTDLREDETVKAVVLRIDSGGGSAFASEIIRDSINATRKKGIPVVVSMSGVAASGGYWIAAETDRILAMSTSITGSIGVWGVIPTIDQSLANLGVYSDGVGTTDISAMMEIDRPLSLQTKSIFQSGVDNIYTRFLELVANGRGSTPDDVHEIAQGRVWTGNQALVNGLVDELGDLNDAIEIAATFANLDDYQIDYRRKKMSPMETLLTEINGNVTKSLRNLGLNSNVKTGIPQSLQRYAKKIFGPLIMIDNLNDPRGLYLYCEDCPL